MISFGDHPLKLVCCCEDLLGPRAKMTLTKRVVLSCFCFFGSFGWLVFCCSCDLVLFSCATVSVLSPEVKYIAQAPAEIYADPSPAIEHVAPAPAVADAALAQQLPAAEPVATASAASLLIYAAPAPVENTLLRRPP